MVTINRRKLSQVMHRKINDDHGLGTVGYALDIRNLKTDRYSTGSLALDFALGGGVPAGNITLLYGDRSSGKTTTMLRIIADAQRRCANCLRIVPDLTVEEVADEDTGEIEWRAVGTCDCCRIGLFKPRQARDEKADVYRDRLSAYQENSFEESRCLFMDAEKALDMEWAQLVGIDLRRLLLSTPHSAEEAIDVYVQYVNSGFIDVFALDSIAALTPITEIEESVVKQQQGLAARLVNKFVRTSVAASVAVEKVRGRAPTQLWSNQTRQKIGVMFGDGTTLPGGKGQLFAASCMIKFWSQKGDESDLFDGLNKDERMKIAKSIQQCFKIEKNKVGSPKGEGRFDLIVSGAQRGNVDEFGYLMHHAQRYNILRKEGVKWMLEDTEFRTQKDAHERVRDPIVQAALRDRILKLMLEESNR